MLRAGTRPRVVHAVYSGIMQQRRAGLRAVTPNPALAIAPRILRSYMPVRASDRAGLAFEYPNAVAIGPWNRTRKEWLFNTVRDTFETRGLER